MLLAQVGLFHPNHRSDQLFGFGPEKRLLERLGREVSPDAQASASYSVEPLSPMAPPDAQAAASYGCSAVLSYWLRWLRVPIDWGQSIYHNDAQRRRLMAVRLFCPTGCGGFRFRSIGDNRSTITTRSGGVLRLFGCFFRSDDQTKNW